MEKVCIIDVNNKDHDVYAFLRNVFGIFLTKIFYFFLIKFFRLTI